MYIYYNYLYNIYNIYIYVVTSFSKFVLPLPILSNLSLCYILTSHVRQAQARAWRWGPWISLDFRLSDARHRAWHQVNMKRLQQKRNVKSAPIFWSSCRSPGWSWIWRGDAHHSTLPHAATSAVLWPGVHVTIPSALSLLCLVKYVLVHSLGRWEWFNHCSIHIWDGHVVCHNWDADGC